MADQRRMAVRDAASELLVEQPDLWLVQRRYPSQESLTALYVTNERCALVDADQPALSQGAPDSIIGCPTSSVR